MAELAILVETVIAAELLFIGKRDAPCSEGYWSTTSYPALRAQSFDELRAVRRFVFLDNTASRNTA